MCPGRPSGRVPFARGSAPRAPKPFRGLFSSFFKKERECRLFPANFVYLQAISCVHARKISETDCCLRYQHHRGEVPELPAHALLYPYFRAGNLWHRGRYLCPYPTGAHAADDGHGVELLPLLGQGRGGWRRRAGRQTETVRHDLGRYLPCRGPLLRAGGGIPSRCRGPDGRGVCRASRVCGLGGDDYPVRRVGLHSVLAAAGAGAGVAVCRHQGAECRVECRAGNRFRLCRAFRHRIRRRLGFRCQPDCQCRYVAGDSCDHRPHRSENQLGAARRGLRLFAAAAGGRTGGHGQRVHRPPVNQIPRA